MKPPRALDPDSEAILRQNLSKIAEGRTVIIVSHRLTTLVDADAILVVDRGKIRRYRPPRSASSRAALPTVISGRSKRGNRHERASGKTPPKPAGSRRKAGHGNYRQAEAAAGLCRIPIRCGRTGRARSAQNCPDDALRDHRADWHGHRLGIALQDRRGGHCTWQADHHPADHYRSTAGNIDHPHDRRDHGRDRQGRADIGNA